MPTPSPSPEVARAAELLKARQRNAAGHLLKSYLTRNPRDADAWWLMSHVVSDPANVRTCLERVLRLRPDDARARARLAQLDPLDEPDDSFFVVSRPITGDAARTPPFVTAVDDLPASAEPARREPSRFDPWADLGEFDPFAGIDTGEQNPFAAPHAGQAPGTGRQPDWGPGLGFVSDAAAAGEGIVPGRVHDYPGRREPREGGASGMLVGIVVIGFVLIALVAVLVVVAKQRGWFGLGGLPAMQTLDGWTFTLEFPEKWGGICKADPQGYPVCGIANDPRFNEVDFYTGQAFDPGQMISSAIGGLLDFRDPPNLMLSIIAMDVLESSPRYSRVSQAQTLYQAFTEYGGLEADDYVVDYKAREQVIDGYDARVYRLSVKSKSGGLKNFVLGNDGDWALYDVYVPHDGRMFWLSVQAFSNQGRAELPLDTIEHIIDSIHFKAT